METAELVGMVVALILVVVMVLFVTSNYPDFVDEIKDLFEDVFGFTHKKMLGRIEEKNKETSLRIFDEIKNAYKNCKGEDCVCGFNAYDMPKNYEIVLDGETITLYDNKRMILKQEGLKTDNCIMNSLDSYELVDKMVISYDRGLRMNGYKLKEDYPKLYITKDNKLCFINPKAEYFVNSIKCGTDEKYSLEEMEALFNRFIFNFESCLSNKKDKPLAFCRCSEIDFRDKLYPSYSIVANSSDGGVVFLLMFGNHVLESKSYNFDSGEVNIRDEGLWNNFIGWIRSLTIISFFVGPEKYVNIFDYKELNDFSGYLVRMKKHIKTGEYFDGVFLSEDFPNLPACSGWDDVYEEGCSIDSPKEKFDRINKSYLGILNENVKDIHRRLLLMGIMATETININPEAVSPTGVAGLMQFEYKTAKGIPLFNGKLVRCCEFDVGENKNKIQTICDMERKNGNYKCNRYNDARFDPELSIKAADYLLSQKIKFFENKGYSNSEVFGVAAYNVGEGNIRNVIESGKLKKDTSWQEVKEELKKKLSKFQYNQVRCYPYRVKVYYDYFRSKLVKEGEKFGEKTKLEDIETELSKKEKEIQKEIYCIYFSMELSRRGISKKEKEKLCIEKGCFPHYNRFDIGRLSYTGGYDGCGVCPPRENLECSKRGNKPLCELNKVCGVRRDCIWVNDDVGCMDREEFESLTKLFNEIKEAYETCSRSKDVDCVCDFEIDEFPLNYKVELDKEKIVFYTGVSRILKQSYLYPEIDLCVMDSVNSSDDVKIFTINYDGELCVSGIKISEDYLYGSPVYKEFVFKGDYLRFYKIDNGKICVIDPQVLDSFSWLNRCR
jgi:hypothetical protein